ncbi:hypothetical protein BJV74DRAFT_889259 [Russula compacta]|nr:hypothetical protein BJV74DRAFT_889259 [Russula compacta]
MPQDPSDPSESSRPNSAIRPIDSKSVHRITSGQVIVDLQIAAKELVENFLDAGATNIEVRFKDCGLKTIEVIDNGTSITPEDYESIGTHGTVLVFDNTGRLTSCSGKVARQIIARNYGHVMVTGLFVPLPVRRKGLERYTKRDFTKALNLIIVFAYSGKKTTQLRTDVRRFVESEAWITGPSTQALTSCLATFARDGVRPVKDMENEGDSDSPEDEEGAEQTLADEERNSSLRKINKDVDDDEMGDEGRSSTDVVDKTIAIDPSDSEDNQDEPLKQPNDVSYAAATVASPPSPQVDDDLTSNEEPLPSLSSEGAPSGGVVPTAPSSPSKVSNVCAEVVRMVVGVRSRTYNQCMVCIPGAEVHLQPPQPAPRSSNLESADLGADDENATAALARVLSKADFSLMDVVASSTSGLSWRLRKAGGRARLRTCSSRRRDSSLRGYSRGAYWSWTAADELVALENMGVLQKNGFEVALDGDQPAGRRLKLLAQPVCKNTESDIEGEMLASAVLTKIVPEINDSTLGNLVRSSKTCAMFAMRACRRGTMAGAALNTKQMTTAHGKD